MNLKLIWKLASLYRWWKGGMEGMDTERLKSRKLWVTILGSLAVTLLIQVGAPESVTDNIRWIVLTYLGGQSCVDLMAAKNGK